MVNGGEKGARFLYAAFLLNAGNALASVFRSRFLCAHNLSPSSIVPPTIPKVFVLITNKLLLMRAKVQIDRNLAILAMQIQGA